MQLDVEPPLSGSELIALETALARVSLRDGSPPSYVSAWRRSAAREAVENEPARRRYALSPRSTRGATRA